MYDNKIRSLVARSILDDDPNAPTSNCGQMQKHTSIDQNWTDEYYLQSPIFQDGNQGHKNSIVTVPPIDSMHSAASILTASKEVCITNQPSKTVSARDQSLANTVSSKAMLDFPFSSSINTTKVGRSLDALRGDFPTWRRSLMLTPEGQQLESSKQCSSLPQAKRRLYVDLVDAIKHRNGMSLPVAQASQMPDLIATVNPSRNELVNHGWTGTRDEPPPLLCAENTWTKRRSIADMLPRVSDGGVVVEKRKCVRKLEMNRRKMAAATTKLSPMEGGHPLNGTNNWVFSQQQMAPHDGLKTIADVACLMSAAVSPTAAATAITPEQMTMEHSQPKLPNGARLSVSDSRGGRGTFSTRVIVTS